MNTTKKPTCKLIGKNGNVFAIISEVSRSLKAAGLHDQSNEFTERAFAAQSYDEVLCLCKEYVEIK